MTRRIIVLLFTLLGCSLMAMAQMPSNAEMNALLDKAEDKVMAFEGAVKASQMDLESNGQTDVLQKDLNLIKTLHLLIDVAREKGYNSYRLVSVLSTLDDAARLSATTIMTLLVVHDCHGNSGQQAGVALLLTASSGLQDISELIFHATLRSIQVEEDFITDALSDKPGGKK